MTTYKTTEIKSFPLRTIVRIDGKSFSFLTEDIISIEGNMVTLSNKASDEIKLKTAADTKSAITKEKKAVRAAAKRKAAMVMPASAMSLAEKLISLSEFYKAGSTMTKDQAKYIAALAEKAGDTMEDIGWNFNSIVSKNEASNLINEYLKG